MVINTKGEKKVIEIPIISIRPCKNQARVYFKRDELQELANMVQSMALCGLGKSAPLPVISTLKRFRDEYVEHIVDKKCVSHTCKAMQNYYINPDKCKGCTKCARNCPVSAISGEKKAPHVIDYAKCIKCGSCKDICSCVAIEIR